MTNPDDNRLMTAELPRSAEQDPTRFMPPADRHDFDGETAAQPHDDVGRLKPTWTAIQIKFVDDPRKAVEEADGLVASTIERLTESFAKERVELEAQWANGTDVSTEDLRLAFRRYRSLFDRLLLV